MCTNGRTFARPARAIETLYGVSDSRVTEGGSVPFTRVISVRGALPQVANMTVTAPNQLLLVSGSAFAPAGGAGRMLRMEILVDANVVGTCSVFANTELIHIPFVPAFIPLTLNPASSPFAVTLRPTTSGGFFPGGVTETDQNDVFEVTLIE
jgi:hypothetical protein